MRARSWIPVVVVPVAAVGVIIGATAAAHSSLPRADRAVTEGTLAPAATPTPPAPAPGRDPDESLTVPKRESVSAPAAGGRMTDSAGVTVYTFSGDKPGVSTCTGACSATWIPVRSLGGKPHPGNGLPTSAVGSIQRPDGSEQVTLYGLPLYYYAGDRGPGTATGQGRATVGGTWTADAPAAPPQKSQAPASPTK